MMIDSVRKNLVWIEVIGLTIGLILIIFRNLIPYSDSYLFDWHDYPLYVWIIYQNISHLQSLSLTTFFNGNIFFPLTSTMLFSDLFLPQSLFGLILSKLSDQPILVFNTIFFLTWILNAAAAVYFWKKLFQAEHLVFFASITTVFSAFIFHNWVHFQILSLWPFLITLAWFYKHQLSISQAVIGGVLLSLCLSASVYLWVILLTCLSVYWLLLLVKAPNKIKMVKRLAVTAVVSLILSAPIILGYLQVRINYQARRDYREYIIYAAQPNDYLFPVHLSSLIGSFPLVHKWAGLSSNAGFFPGMVMAILGLVGLFSKLSQLKLISYKKQLTLSKVNFFGSSGYFLVLACLGFLFSLGPRLSFNGQYIGWPLPYLVLLKFLPPFEIIRVTQRWSLLFFLGLSYFAALGLKRIAHHQAWLLTGSLVLLYCAELIPLGAAFRSFNYYPAAYLPIAQVCQQQKVNLLEYPLTQFVDGVNISTNLTYRTAIMLASVNHGCDITNGYSGFIPREYQDFEEKLSSAVEEKDQVRFINLLSGRQVRIFKLNKNDLFADRVELIKTWLKDDQKLKVLFEDSNYLVVVF